MMKAGLAAVVWLGLTVMAGAAMAQGHGDQKAVVAECGTDGACRCYMSERTMTEAAGVLGTDLPADPDSFVMVAPDGTIGWSKITRGDLEIALGGAGSCPIELFQDWEPEDGTWDGVTTLTGAAGSAECTQIGTMVVGMMNSALGTAQVTWGGAFDMDRFYAATGPQPGDDVPVWTPVNRHVVTGRGGGDGMTTDYRAELLSPRRFVLTTRIAGEGCTFDLRTDARKAG